MFENWAKFLIFWGRISFAAPRFDTPVVCPYDRNITTLRTRRTNVSGKISANEIGSRSKHTYVLRFFLSKHAKTRHTFALLTALYRDCNDAKLLLKNDSQANPEQILESNV